VQQGDKVMIALDINGFMPNLTHRALIDEENDCSSGNGMSAGGPPNPLAKAPMVESSALSQIAI
jgi:hypothetical protein